MSTVLHTRSISSEEYLQGELSSEVKHELIDGYTYAMAGASANYNRITQKLQSSLLRFYQNQPEKQMKPLNELLI